MKKRVFIISASLILAALMLASCGKDGGIEEKDGTTAAPVEFSTEENGDVYVTNVSGDHIPVTTDKSGMMELYEDLVTKTPEQVSKEKEEIDNSNEAETNESPSAGGEAATSGGETATSSGSVIVGDKNDSSRDAVIDLT